MTRSPSPHRWAALAAACSLLTLGAKAAPAQLNVRDFGAVGDGQTLDSPAINKAIQTAHDAGGGTVIVPAGTYLSGSIHLLSYVTLELDSGSHILATKDAKAYEPAEPNPAADKNQYEDFGHRHWHNSLFWADGEHDFAVTGTGLIEGRALSRGAPKRDNAVTPIANKTFGLKNCRNVLLRDVSILYGGWFGILAIGVDNFTLENLKIDTNRDGMDIDSCRNVHVSDCSVNSPFDDGICLKATYGLGYNRACENITITNCHVSGFDVGSFLDGTYKREYRKYSKGGPTGRIKFGTEANGGFKNVTVSNCTFDYCRGLALEEVDGGWLEDVTITGLTMRDITNSAIYVRLGSRDRGPEGTVPGYLRRVSISHVVASNVDPKYSSIIAGIPGHPIEDLTLSDIHIQYQGGGTAEQAAIVPPENEGGYPEPANHGTMPAYGFFVRHALNLAFHDVEVGTIKPDARPAFVLDDVKRIDFDHVREHKSDAKLQVKVQHVSDLTVRASQGLTDKTDPAAPSPDGMLP